MKGKFHGIDLHKRYATIMIRDSEGREIQYISKCTNFEEYIESLTENDSVVIESINNAFYWADKIEMQGAACIIVDPHKFKIIKDSWNKTDKRDAANLSLALWMSEMKKEFKMPTVYKPSAEIRAMRKLFAEYQMITNHITQYKNSIQAIFMENGITLNKKQAHQLFKPDGDISILDNFKLTKVSKECIIINLSLMWDLLKKKENIKHSIFELGMLFEKEIKLCISMKGISPFLVLAFLADIGDIKRFKNVKGFDAYLGVVPTVKSSGGKTQMGHINKQSRKLARTLFTQPVNHFVNSSDSMSEFYEEVKLRGGAGKSRIAVIRKVFNIMRRMILSGEVYRDKDEKTYNKKLKEFEKFMQKAA